MQRLAILGMVLLTFSAAQADWPVFRGNAFQDGTAAGALPDKLEVVWKFTAKDSIESAAAVVGDRVYVGSLDEHFYALDLATGKEAWKFKAGPFKAPAGVRNGRVYVGDMDGKFFCLDAATGKPVWKFDTSTEITSGANFAGDTVLFGSADETLYCLDAQGKEKWKFKIQGGPVNGTPVVVEGRTFVAGCDGQLHVLDAATGKEQASLEVGGPVGATVAARGDHTYVGTMNRELLAIDWKQAKVAWTFQPAKGSAEFYASPAATEGLVVIGSRNRRIYALDRKTGAEVWSYLTGQKVDSSPVVVGKRVYVGSSDGHLYVLGLEKGELVQKLQLDGPVSGSPAVVTGRLVIGTEKGTVYCLGSAVAF